MKKIKIGCAVVIGVLSVTPLSAYYLTCDHVKTAFMKAEEYAKKKLEAKKQAILDNIEDLFSEEMITNNAADQSINEAQRPIFMALAVLDADAAGIKARIDDLAPQLDVTPGELFDIRWQGEITAALIGNTKKEAALADTVANIRDHVLPLFQKKFPASKQGEIVTLFAKTTRDAHAIKDMAVAFGKHLPDGVFGRKANKIRSGACFAVIKSFVMSVREITELETLLKPFHDPNHSALKNPTCIKIIEEFITSDKPIAEYADILAAL